MNVLIAEPPSETMQEGDEGENLQRYVAIGENATFICLYWLNAEDEQDCRQIIAQDFLRRDRGMPTKFTMHTVSESVEDFNVGTNDEDIHPWLRDLKEADFLDE
jgi:hypothetical protein